MAWIKQHCACELVSRVIVLILSTSVHGYAEKNEPAEQISILEKTVAPQHAPLIRARLYREKGQFKEALEELQKADLSQLSESLKSKIEMEMEALEKLNAGWSLPPGDIFGFQLSTAQLLVRTGGDALGMLDELIHEHPNRWEPVAEKARVLAMTGADANSIVECLDKAEELGGEQAKLATTALRQHTLTLEQARKSAEEIEALAKRNRITQAAQLLEARWKENPERVELALQALKYRTKTRKYADVSRLAKSVAAYLKEHPTSRYAQHGPALEIAAQQSDRALQLQARIGQAKSTSKSRTASSKANAPPQKSSMSSKFLRRTGN